MSDLAVAALSVSELARFAEPKQFQQSAAEDAVAGEEPTPTLQSDTSEGVGTRVDISI